MVDEFDWSSVLDIPTDIWEQMRMHVSQLAPEEACGMLAGQGRRAMRVFPVENALHSPTRFLMEAHQQLAALEEIERQDWELVGIYHSHPAGPETPSPTDLAEAYYPEAAALIWSRPAGIWQCRAFQILTGEVRELAIKKT